MSFKEIKRRIAEDYARAKMMYAVIIASFIFPFFGILYWPHFYLDFLVVIFYGFVIWEIITRIQIVFGKDQKK